LILILSSITAAYAGVVLLLVWKQDALVFPGAGRGDRGHGDHPRVRAISATREGGRTFRIAIAAPQQEARAVALYFVGNGEDLLSAAQGAASMADYGMEVFGVEHPGYGASEGPPGVAALMAAASAAAAIARRRADELGVPLVSIGTSLGSFCAVHVAASGVADRLVLRAPPASMLAAAQARFAWAPVALVLRHPFNNLARAGEVKCPALVLHGDLDRVVPIQQGRALAAAMGGPAHFVEATGYQHNNVPFEREGPFGPRIAEFLGLL
jgi:hypothetical protein